MSSPSFSMVGHAIGYSTNIELVIYIVNSDAFFFLIDIHINRHYEAWSYKKGSTKNIAGYRKNLQLKDVC